MERIGAFSAGRYVLADMDHFLYVKRGTLGMQKAYLMCRESTCPCSVKWQQDENTIIFHKPHNHAPMEVDYQELLFRQSLRHRASVENTPMRIIFRQEQQKNPVGSQRTTYSEISKLMYRARQAETPPIPTSVEDFGRIITDQRWFRRYGSNLGRNENEFFRTILECKFNPIAIFVSESIRQFVPTLEDCHIHLDATFEVVPINGMSTQLFIIHLHASNTVFPLLMAFMQIKSEDGYVRVLQYLKRTVAIEPTVVMADYDNALRNAVGKVWPNAKLLGCWFHYARAVFQKSRQLGLQGIMKEELTKVSMVLPLLPDNRIKEGINYLEKEGIDGEFLNYLRQQWEGQDISVYGMDQRINNSVESFHRDLFTRIGRSVPNIWALLDILRFIEHAKVGDIQNLVAGRILPCRKRPKFKRGNRLLVRCQEQLTVKNDIPQYLRSVSRLADRLVRLFGPVEDIATQRSSNSSLCSCYTTSVDADIVKLQDIETSPSATNGQKSERRGGISSSKCVIHSGHLSNLEDAYSLTIKQENLLDAEMNIEYEEIIKSEVPESYEGDQHEERGEASPDRDFIISELSCSETIEDINMIKLCSESGKVEYHQNSPISSVKKTLFKKSNEQIRKHNKSQKLSTESFGETREDLNNQRPEISINTNIDKFQLSDIHSTTQNHNVVKEAPHNEKTCSDSTKNQLPDQQSIHKIIAFKEVPINTEIIYLNKNNISFRERECYRDSGTIPSISPQTKVSRDNQNILSNGNKLGLLILKNSNGENSQPSEKYDGSSSSSEIFFMSDRCTEHVHDPACDNSNSQIDTHNASEESVRKTDDIEMEESNKYVFVTIKPFEKPKDIAGASKIIQEIDKEMGKLINLRHSLMVDMVKDQSFLHSKRKNQNESESLSKRK